MGYCKMKVLNFDNNIHVYDMLWKGFWKKIFRSWRCYSLKQWQLGLMGTSINDHLKRDNLSIEFLFLRKTSDSSIFTTYMVLGQLLCLKLKKSQHFDV